MWISPNFTLLGNSLLLNSLASLDLFLGHRETEEVSKLSEDCVSSHTEMNEMNDVAFTTSMPRVRK